MFVVPEQRQKGVGGYLFEKALDIALDARKASLVFSVEKNNSAAVQFYKKHGAKIFMADDDSYWMAVILTAGQLGIFDLYTKDREEA